MIILGISALDNDTNVNLLIDGKLIFATAEERYTRKKQQEGFPHRALEDALNYTSITTKDIDHVVYPFLPASGEIFHLTKNMLVSLSRAPYEPIPLKDRIMNIAAINYGYFVGVNIHLKFYNELIKNLRKLGLSDKLTTYHHHKCHAANSYFFSGLDPCLSLCIDGYGTGLGVSIWKCKNGSIQYLDGIQATDSVGRMYAKVTKALGFKADRHEGKILGLAACGDPDYLYYLMKKRFRLKKNGHFRLYGLHSMKFFFKELFKKEKREDIAAIVQRVLEETIIHFLKPHVKRTGIRKIVLSGGVVANVKLNQRIAECEGVEKVFVFPAMADTGTGVGASLLKAAELGEAKVRSLDTVLLGRNYSESEILSVLNSNGYKYHYLHKPEDLISDLLIEGKIVGWFDNRIEFGPRALGSRSVLVRATDPNINNELNRRLGRSEFMPFAPVTLFEGRHSCYKNVDIADHAAQFMTITFDCHSEMIKKSPATVHVDGTARPQLIKKEINPKYYNVLKRYYEKTGILSIINTSFNMHEEPIVLTPEDALSSFSDGKLDYLFLAPYIISYKEAILKENDPLLNLRK